MLPVTITAGLQIFLNVFVWSLIARWYVAPRLLRLPRHEALIPPILIHLVRPISLWTTLPGIVVSSSIPLEWAYSTAIGDLVATALALLALLSLRLRWRSAFVLTWIFNVLGLLDALKNGILAARLGVIAQMGAGALIPTYAVPVLLVSHGLIFWLLWKQRNEQG